MRNMRIPLAVSVGALALMGMAFAQRPETDIDPRKHPTLAEAQQHVLVAADKVKESQKYYKDDLGGHAQKAVELLDQANHEIKEAAEYLNQHHK